MNRIALVLVLVGVSPALPTWARADLGGALDAIRMVGREGAGNVQATEAWRIVSQASSDQIVDLLAAMHDNEPLACNYLRAAVDTVVQREQAAGRVLPKDALVGFLKDTEMSSRGRRTAYELLQRIVPDAEQQFIPGMINDPCLELRRDAVARLFTEAAQLEEAGQAKKAIATYGKAFHAARDVDQINKAYDALNKLDAKADLARHYGFIMRWHVVAPFDNVGNKGFDVTNPPEEKVDLDATYSGKQNQQVTWRTWVSDDPNGIVDFNAAFKDDQNPNKGQGGNYKGAVGYAYTEFVAPSDQTVDLRVGCINGNKVWVNGDEVLSNEVYHSGMEIDQYVTPVELKKGKNQILVKLAQNEQTEQWAQRWQFQLRICDPIGTAILSADRPLSDQTALRSPNRGTLR